MKGLSGSPMAVCGIPRYGRSTEMSDEIREKDVRDFTMDTYNQLRRMVREDGQSEKNLPNKKMILSKIEEAARKQVEQSGDRWV